VIRVPDLDLSIKAGDILFITGGSGTGKTALLNCFGLLPNCRPKENKQLQFIDADGNTFEPTASGNTDRARRLRRSEIGHISSHGALFRFLTLRQNICLERSDPTELDALVKSLGLGCDQALLDQHPSPVTPIDIQRKVLVARELIKRPRLLVADDPVSGVGPDTQKRIWETLLQQKSEGRPAVIIALRRGSNHAPSMKVLEEAIAQGYKMRCMDGQFKRVESETRFDFIMIGPHDKDMSAAECHGHLVSLPAPGATP
jgi:ABC-type lipoprotein export system ATPase subunit